MLALAAVAAVPGFAPGTALAQNEPTATEQQFDQRLVERGNRLWAGRGGCTNCHGWAGDGASREPFPAGANLRETFLDAEQIAEVIKCGRPATAMPHFDKAAYSDGRCYDLTADDLGFDKPALGVPLRGNQFEALATYILAKVKGRGPITRAECSEYFGTSAGCDRY